MSNYLNQVNVSVKKKYYILAGMNTENVYTVRQEVLNFSTHLQVVKELCTECATTWVNKPIELIGWCRYNNRLISTTDRFYASSFNRNCALKKLHVQQCIIGSQCKCNMPQSTISFPWYARSKMYSKRKDQPHNWLQNIQERDPWNPESQEIQTGNTENACGEETNCNNTMTPEALRQAKVAVFETKMSQEQLYRQKPNVQRENVKKRHAKTKWRR